MAERVLFNIAEQILANLASEVLKNTKFPRGVKKELLKLESTLSTVKAVVVDAEEKQRTNNQVRVWLDMLEDVVYDADNLVEEFRYEEVRRRRAKKVRLFFSSSNQLAFRLKIGNRIRKIRKKLDEIKANRSLHLEERLEEARSLTAMRMRETHSFVPNDEVVGRDADKRAILQVLLNSGEEIKENVSVIPIVGIGGLGKTTLAQLVFNDDEVQNHFEKRIWVCVSDVFDVKLLVEKIIKSVTCQSPDQNLDMEQLQHWLRKEIRGRRYLLVLDDVWNEDGEKWLRLERLLRGGARGSGVIITTRSEIVAKITKTVQPYMLRGLDEDKSWTLFQRMAFEEGKVPAGNSGLMEIGKQIVDKCKGVPLAIKTIGRLLQTRDWNSRNPEKEWMLFMKKELAEIDHQSESDIIPTLKLSYNSLPSHLKHCFAFCGLLPKDHEIDVQKLINLWVAQDFVKPNEQSQLCLEDVGYEYFMGLLWRSFFQEAKEDELGKIKSCKMHDLMHDLAVSVAGKGIATLDQSGWRFGSVDCSVADRNTENFRHKVHHLYVHSESDACQILASSLFVQENIRTLVFSKFLRLDSSSLDVVLSNFKFLRALSLSGIIVGPLPHGLCKLKHLKYLDLSNNKEIKVLPSRITRLHNLQTLILSGCTKLERLPQGIKNLTNLRHLEIDGCWSLTHVPRGLGELTCLRTLSWFPAVNVKEISKQSGGLHELSKLNHLQGHLAIKLGYGKEIASESKAADLRAKEHLESLFLYWESADADVDNVVENVEMTLDGLQPPQQIKALELQNYVGMRFCTWLSSLNNLVILKLEDCKCCQYLPPLQYLSSLNELTLRNLLSLEYVNADPFSTSSLSSSTMTFFPSLEKLTIIDCFNLKGWWQIKEGDVGDKDEVFRSTIENYQLQLSLLNLSHLAISKSPALTSMPFFPYLEILELYKTNFNPLEQTIRMSNEINSVATSTSSILEIHSSSCRPLSKLKLLNIVCVPDVETLPEMIGNLSSLQSLDICICPKLASLPEEIGSLSSLLFLRINACRNLVSLPEGISNLTSLQSLHIQGCSNLSSLPEGIGKLKSLQSLTIQNFRGLVSLPEGISNLSSLRSLDIQFCSDLASLPGGIAALSSLSSLQICRCPNLLSLPEGLCRLSSLESLEVSRCTNLVSLPEGISRLSSLQSLVVVGCTNLASIPRGIGNLPSLKLVNGQDCSELGIHFSMDTLADYLLDEQRR